MIPAGYACKESIVQNLETRLQGLPTQAKIPERIEPQFPCVNVLVRHMCISTCVYVRHYHQRLII